jgi:hypothetical protein
MANAKMNVRAVIVIDSEADGGGEAGREVDIDSLEALEAQLAILDVMDMVRLHIVRDPDGEDALAVAGGPGGFLLAHIVEGADQAPVATTDAAGAKRAVRWYVSTGTLDPSLAWSLADAAADA